MSNPYQAEADQRAEQARRQPIAESLKETILVAMESASGERLAQLEDALIRVGAAAGPRTGDVRPEDALAFLISLGLLEPGVEPYTVLVAGVKVGVILARNRFHAVNKAKKDFGLTVAEYQFKDRHEVHGARAVAVADPFSRIRS